MQLWWTRCLSFSVQYILTLKHLPKLVFLYKSEYKKAISSGICSFKTFSSTKTSPAFIIFTHSPEAILIPLFIASYIPLSGSLIIRTALSGYSAAMLLAIATVLSFDLPSTTLYSKSLKVWFRTERIVRSISFSAL